MKNLIVGRGTRVSAGLLLVLCLSLLTSGFGWAQDEVTADHVMAYPAGLDDPSLALDELQLRLVPLTVKQLAALATAWQELARAATQASVDKSLEIRAADATEAEALRAERLVLLQEREQLFEKFSTVLASLERKGGDPTEVETMRHYLTAVKIEGRSQLTLQEFADSFLQWLVSPEGGVGIGLRIGVIVASFFGLFIVARIVRAWAKRTFSRVPTLSKLLTGFLVMAVYWLTIAIGLMIVLAALGVNVTPLFALVGGASFIIAFALQETLGNLAAGLMIMLNRPFDEGDYVQVAGLAGTIKHVSVVSTTVTTPDNQVIIIPNSKVWGDVITNVTASDTRRVDLVFGISYGDSIEQAHQVLEQVVANHPLVLADPAPAIRVSELGDSSVNLIVRPWVNTSDYWTVFWDLQRAVKEAFDANGISIPFPQTDMHLHVVDKETPISPAVAPLMPAQAPSPPHGATSYATGDDGVAEPDEGSERG